jgi:hypothetical protein
MKLSQVHEMLEQNPHPQEETWCRLDDGIGYVAARTEMPDCSGKMIDWWFRNLRTTEQYKRWYPQEHVWSDWKGPDNSYVGGTHLVHERLGTPKLAKLKINFRDPAAILDKSRARKAGVSLVVYGRGGPLGLPLWTGHVMHMVHDHEGGCTMRSRYWLGDIAPKVPVLWKLIQKDMTSDVTLAAMQRHCKTEMSILATFLPEIYREAGVRVATVEAPA